jgi:OHCU decarboxylase
MTTNTSRALASLNSLSKSDAEQQLLKCCGSRSWAEQMAATRPFDSVATLQAAAAHIWWSLTPADWLEAFHSHPKIGEKHAAAVVAPEAQQWSEAEQAGTRDASAETMADLAELNEVYEQKFGYIFIVCATGKSPEELLRILRERLPHDGDEELRIAADEQAKITELRLRKLVAN